MPRPAALYVPKKATEFVDFVNASVTPFHVVQTISEKLVANGFVKLEERVQWPTLLPGGRYFVTRNESTLVAFVVGGRYNGQRGLKIVGAHTDSPNFQLKPKTAIPGGDFHEIGVQCYGGGLWHTWFDRDLTVAGRVVISHDGTKLESKLVKIAKPILRIPNLAIHLCNDAERAAFAPNKETNLIPVLATRIMEQLWRGDDANNQSDQSPILMQLLAEEAECKPEEIVDFDLSVVDTQDATVGGAYEEFIFAPRLDNLISCFCGIDALVSSTESVGNDDMIRMVALFDNEEVGSSTMQGAGGSLIPDVMERLALQYPTLVSKASLAANSFLLSVDGAHAVHPNYVAKHEAQHRPLLQKGPVIKYNANERYATNGMSSATLKTLAAKVNCPVQQFCVRNDSSCGSTIGPIMSTLTGIETVDIGNPMLSMHSIREMCGTEDIQHLINLIQSFFSNFQTVRP